MFVFCYDIAHDGRRRRIATMLEKHGVRVQESVFEVRTTKNGAERLAHSISMRIAPQDSIRVYLVPDVALKHCIAHGSAPIGEPGDYLLF